MLVTCPECNAKISSKACPCPSCGLPVAGKLSKENNENIVNSLNSYIGNTVKLFMDCTCREDARRKDARPNDLYPKLIGAELVNYNTGHGTKAVLQCPKCKKTQEFSGGSALGQMI